MALDTTQDCLAVDLGNGFPNVHPARLRIYVPLAQRCGFSPPQASVGKEQCKIGMPRCVCQCLNLGMREEDLIGDWLLLNREIACRVLCDPVVFDGVVQDAVVTSPPKQKRNLTANSEWWTRAQWALEATLSGNEKLNVYGLRMLWALAKSEAADSKEKEVLDAVWQASSTKMQGDAISQFLADAIELKILPEVQDNPQGSADGEAAGTPRRRYSPDRRDQVLSTLRLEILTAGLKVTLDQELGRET